MPLLHYLLFDLLFDLLFFYLLFYLLYYLSFYVLFFLLFDLLFWFLFDLLFILIYVSFPLHPLSLSLSLYHSLFLSLSHSLFLSLSISLSLSIPLSLTLYPSLTLSFYLYFLQCSPSSNQLLSVGQDDQNTHILWTDLGGRWSTTQQTATEKVQLSLKNLSLSTVLNNYHAILHYSKNIYKIWLTISNIWPYTY